MIADDEFIDQCHRMILGRPVDPGSASSLRKQLKKKRLTREQIPLLLLESEEFRSRVDSTEFVPAGHFYSAIPSLDVRRDYTLPSAEDSDIAGVNVNRDAQVRLLERFKTHYDECPFPEDKIDGRRYYFNNPAYSYTDAIALYCMMREFQPRRVVEIGSGFSSCAMLDTSDLHFNGEIDFTFVEPYPELLRSLIADSDRKHQIIATPLQEVDAGLFGRLERNDILFVDSTHVSKLNSDVNRLIFDILPRLNEGVLVHFHDIFWPFEYPRKWVSDGRVWNEAYILRAFLQFNDSFEIMFFSHYLHQREPQWLRDNMPLCLKNPGGNIWLRRTRQGSAQ